MKHLFWETVVLAVIVGLWMSSLLMAQPGPGGGGPGGGGFDPAQFRQMRLDMIREQLTAKDDEWKVLQPKIEKIIDLQPLANVGGGRGMMGMGRGGPGGPGGQGGPGGGRGFGPGGQPNAVQEKVQAVNAAVEANANDQELKQKMTAAREARNKAREDLAKARKDLIEVLTTRQEAILFGMGIVE
jgi:hypothetical protein